MKKITVGQVVRYAILGFLSFAILFPLVFTAISSLMPADEVLRHYGAIGQESTEFMRPWLIPETISLRGYEDVFLRSSLYLSKFWLSLFLSAVIVAGQTFVACVSGYGLAKFSFSLRGAVVSTLVVLMLMPLQVTIIPSYMTLEFMGLIGSYWAVILPGVFSVFGVFLMSQVYASVPRTIIEAAKIDGAGPVRILFQIVMPYSKSGIAALVALVFIDNWNMVEQPLLYLKDFYKYPLSVFLSYINTSRPGVAFVCAVLSILPALFVFLFLKDHLIEGIKATTK